MHDSLRAATVFGLLFFHLKAAATNRCVEFLSDPFASLEKIELRIEELIFDVNSRFGNDLEQNRALDDLLKRLVEEGQVYQSLQETLLSDQSVSASELSALQLRLDEIQSELDVLRLQSNGATHHLTQHSMGADDRYPIALTKKAQKDLEKLQPGLREKYQDFINEVSAGGLRNLNSNWHLEALTRMPEIGDYSIRLNRGYRVVFAFSPAAGFTILHISKTITHNN